MVCCRELSQAEAEAGGARTQSAVWRTLPGSQGRSQGWCVYWPLTMWLEDAEQREVETALKATLPPSCPSTETTFQFMSWETFAAVWLTALLWELNSTFFLLWNTPTLPFVTDIINRSCLLKFDNGRISPRLFILYNSGWIPLKVDGEQVSFSLKRPKTWGSLIPLCHSSEITPRKTLKKGILFYCPIFPKHLGIRHLSIF